MNDPMIIWLIAAVAAAVVLLVWFRRRKVRVVASTPEYREQILLTSEAFVPPAIVIERGRPAKLRFVSAMESPITEVSLAALGVTRKIVPGKITTVDLQVEERGCFALIANNGAEARVIACDRPADDG